MKPASLAAIITLFFFLFTFSTKSSPVRAATPEPVVDTSGEKLKDNVNYYVLPASSGGGSGLSTVDLGNSSCPHIVVQEKSELSKGHPVLFLPLNSNDNVISTSTNLNIKFSEKASLCGGESGVWKLTEFISETMHVATNGVAGTNQDIFNWFMIEKVESEGVYKFKFCPKPPFVACQDIGILYVGEGGKGYVGLAKSFTPLRVKFQKVNDINDDDVAVMSS